MTTNEGTPTMPTIEPHRTLAELVTAHPELASPLDALGLDFCCGGQRRLDVAVAAAGLDLAAVSTQLEATAPKAAAGAEPEWQGMDGLVDHLETTHHAYLRAALPRLAALADKVAGVHGANHPELDELAALVHEIRADLEPHLDTEEQVLFPMIRGLAAAMPTSSSGSLDDSLRLMLDEHDRVGELLAGIRTVTGEYRVPDDGCASYRALYAELAELEADTHVHVHKENNELFPMARQAEDARMAAT